MRALMLTSLLCLATPARAGHAAWLELESACPATAQALAQRVDATLVGERDPELTVAVTIRESGSGFEVALRTVRRGETLAAKVVAAPNCDEAVDAAAVVLALALGESVAATTEPAPGPAAQPEPQSEPPPELVAAPVWSRVTREPQRDPGSQQRSDGSLRLALSAGVDAGTLPVSTAYLAAGLRRTLGDVELYGVVLYGAPHVEETASDAGSERTRLDFGALGLGACYGVGSALYFSACAGGEIGVVRSAHQLRLGDRTEVDTDVARARLAGVLTALLAYRGGAIEPQLELAGVAPSLGLRAGVGAAVRF